MAYLSIVISVVFIFGILTFFLVGRKPEFFWPALIALPIIFSGFMIAGRPVVDEYFLAAVIAGGFLAAWRGLVPRGDNKKLSFHWQVFLFAVVYFAIQSLRGAFVLEDIKILRWVGYFLLFGALFFLVRKWQFPQPGALLTAKITSIASVIYFGAYFLLGLGSECLVGIFRWVPQGTVWAGSSYAVFPVIFSFPAAVFLLNTNNRKVRWLGWFALFLSILTVGFYESRIGWLALFVMSIFTLLFLGIRRTLEVLPGLVIIFGFTLLFTLSALATPYWLDGNLLDEPYCHTLLRGEASLSEVSGRLFNADWYKVRSSIFWQGMSETVVFPISPRRSDLDRSLHIKAGFTVFSKNPSSLLFGAGTHSHRVLLRSPLEKLYQVELPEEKISSVVRTVGLSAILVDFGLVGLILILLNLFLVFKKLVAGGGWSTWRKASVFLAALILIPIWLIVSDIQDMVIYFLLLMPENLFILFLRDS